MKHVSLAWKKRERAAQTPRKGAGLAPTSPPWRPWRLGRSLSIHQVAGEMEDFAREALAVLGSSHDCVGRERAQRDRIPALDDHAAQTRVVRRDGRRRR